MPDMMSLSTLAIVKLFYYFIPVLNCPVYGHEPFFVVIHSKYIKNN